MHHLQRADAPQPCQLKSAASQNSQLAASLKPDNFQSLFRTEHSYFQLRIEMFNTLNHPMVDAPSVSSATSSSFGKITGVGKNSAPRQIQIGGRIVF